MRRVLIPYDFSPLAQRSLRLALNGVPFGPDVAIDILHVIDKKIYQQKPEAALAMVEALKTYLRKEVTTCSSPDRTVTAEPTLSVVLGDPTHEIMSHADKCGGIMIGGKGHGGWTEGILGTTAMRVVRDAKVSVYVTKDTNAPTVTKHVLCAVDSDAGSVKAMTEAAQLCRQSRATLELVRVIAVAPKALGYPTIIPYPTNSDVALETQALVDFERKALPEPMAHRHVVTFAPSGIASSVAHQAVTAQVDLIVVGARESDLAKRIFGSISESIIQHAPCDVFVVR